LDVQTEMPTQGPVARQGAPDVFESFMSVEEMGAVEEVEASLELVQKAARQGHSGLASIGLFVERA
jgi:predicted ABC-type transport system involved in lysophospholipase L1 biosynthesis ATPase subunit